MTSTITSLLKNYEQHILGQQKNVRLLLTAALAGGHVLIEGVPGTGKTQMVKTLAQLLDSDFKRVQFTPDLLPSDITGSAIYNMKEHDFQTLKGPIFTNVLLADEINRTPAKTQAALLEAMEEKQVTIQGETYQLPDFFFVAATQNPIEFEGTYPLPEAQQDRFFFKLKIDFPTLEEETSVLQMVIEEQTNPQEIAAMFSNDSLLAIQRNVQEVNISNEIADYIVKIVRKTRELEHIQHGASTRAAIAIAKTAQAWAYLDDRDYITPDDVKTVAIPSLRHRVQLSPYAELEGSDIDETIQELVGSVAVPR
ncbi:AAA domain-containing protein [Gracilibacillus salitolerans]|uniref:AAA domain-containing protein n=1 Tax=Gracilibacillus salitolerans TaxID=2663022 RepID=A0A5Q2TGH3_9BACI|nr:MoxR family ATPase [Gracilibacillus salitolerans]QGH33030.1 AAA domain-containing protein [Gracilibacillus salitolerans]